MPRIVVFASPLSLTKEQAAVVIPILMTPGVVVQAAYHEGTPLYGSNHPYYVEQVNGFSLFCLPDSNFLSQKEWEALKKTAAPATLNHNQENS